MTDRTVLGFTLLALTAFAVMMITGTLSGGAGMQEPFEVYARPDLYAPALAAVAGPLRVTLFLDLIFMTGYGGALISAASRHGRRAPVFGQIAGIGTAVLVLLDMAENLTMLEHLDRVVAGGRLSETAIAAQAGISGLKWFTAAMVLVSLSMILPQRTGLERLLVWAARLFMPLGTGLFVTGAFGLREAGGLLILAGMGGGLVLLALTTALRLRRT